MVWIRWIWREFFTLKGFLVEAFYKAIDVLPENPDEVPERLNELQMKLAEAEQKILEDFKTMFIEQREHLERFLQQIFTDKDTYIKMFGKCFNVSVETAKDANFKEVALSCIANLWWDLFSLPGEVYDRVFHAEEIDAERERLRSLAIKHYKHYLELKEKVEALSIINDSITRGEIKDEYGLILEAVILYKNLSYNFGVIVELNRNIAEAIDSNKDVFHLMKSLMEVTGVGEADFVKAYSHLMRYAMNIVTKIEYDSSLKPKDRVLRELFLGGLGAALAYVLAHVDGRVDLNELARELETYVSSRPPCKYEEEKKELYLDLIRIVSLPLCLEGEVDWRLPVSLGFSASRYWRRWDDASSFIELCRGLRTLSQYASKEEVERVLTYASLFGDYDFIIKLYPLLSSYRSLRKLASSLF